MNICTAKYLAQNLELDINIRLELGERVLGHLGDKKIRMITEIQENDFDYKLSGGESLNEVSNRMNIAINRILKKNSNKNVVIFTHKRAIMGYLLKYLEQGFNLDDRLILTFNDKVIIDDIEKDIDIIKVEFNKEKVVNVDIIE